MNTRRLARLVPYVLLLFAFAYGCARAYYVSVTPPPPYTYRSDCRLRVLGAALADYGRHTAVLPNTDTESAFRQAMDSVDRLSDEDYTVPHTHMHHTLMRTHMHYAVNAFVSGKRIADLPQPDFTVILYEPEPAADETVGFITVRGDLGRVNEALWPEFKRISHIR